MSTNSVSHTRDADGSRGRGVQGEVPNPERPYCVLPVRKVRKQAQTVCAVCGRQEGLHDDPTLSAGGP